MSTDLPSLPPAVEPGIGPEAETWSRGWVRIAIALVVAGQGMAFGLAANMTPATGAAFWVLHGGLAASALGVFALLGRPLLRECLAALRGGRVTVDLLFLLSLAGSFGVSVFSSVRREGPVFYELVAILLAIYTAGKLLGARSRARALREAETLRTDHGRCIVLAADGSRREEEASSVGIGSRVVVDPGGIVCVDGVIESGEALVQTTPLTGEPQPEALGPGAPIFAGMRPLDGALVVRATAPGGSRRLDAMIAAIEEARLRPSRLLLAADRMAARFVPLVVAVSLGTFAWWWMRADLVAAVENALSVLVVACPCALGLATPLGVWMGMVRLGRLGVVARSGDAIDGFAQARVALFDKTGTLCEPGLVADRVVILPGGPLPAAALRAAVLAAEAGIDHPVADALRSAFAGGEVADGFSRQELRLLPGRGIAAQVRDASTGWIHEVAAGPAGGEAARRRLLVRIDGVAAAEVVLEERARAGAAEVFRRLRRLGLEVEILTGDPAFGEATWPEVPRKVGLGPDAKAERVRELQGSGREVLFVGDGLNDAPALAAADMSVAIRGGADLARGNALAVIPGDGLAALPGAVRLAREVTRTIRANIALAVVYNTAGMGLAAAGLVHPVLAALLMAGSSALVSARVMRAGADVVP